ncbi:muconolactone Delta-isomerase family protein [Pontibacter sp. G13]|uniref:muconolactone Delta-isomerase family protein n=1 Tax=Pontibacter sp. G13 TaxID=3074898 RepID=UPI00288BAD3F|nr:muconolactone Delta-isomerase family protein [Pontibacter sp. G13]WNJ16360.1 hypothetical protein RJD25_15965 [Pontibacter sp. G13]
MFFPPLEEYMVDQIPAQRDRIQDLVEDGSIRSYTLSLRRDRFWLVMVAETDEELVDLIESLPMTDFCDYQYYPLMFHDMATYDLPRLSLN